tara:strand:+ start:196 stop:357 length:162 start_codon:yes stop_codon:yes gene_type:complete
MSKFKLDKVVDDIAKYQKSETKKKKDISITSLENALSIALMKLVARDGGKPKK